MKKLLFLSFLLILPISCFPGGKLILQTNDDYQIECKQDQQVILMQSRTIKNTLEDMGDEDESIVPLADISANTFDQIMQCLKPLAKITTLKDELEALEGPDKKDKEEIIKRLKIYYDEDDCFNATQEINLRKTSLLKTELKALEDQDKKNKEEEIKAKELEMTNQLNSYSEDDLFNVIQATSFLDIPALLDYACQIWSDNYELKRLENNRPSFDNAEIIEKLKNINVSSIKNFFIKQYFENHTPDVQILSHQDLVSSASYSPEGTKIASALANGTVRIWDAQTNERLHTLSGHGRSVHSACYNPDSTQFASATPDGTIDIWDAKTGCCLHNLKHHKVCPVASFSYSPDGTQLASFSSNKNIYIWNIGKPVRNLEKQTYHQLLLHALCKKTIESNETLDLANNSYLSEFFNSLELEQQEFLKKITQIKQSLNAPLEVRLQPLLSPDKQKKLLLTKTNLLRFYNYTESIAWHTLNKKTILNISNNSHLSEISNRLQSEQQTFLQEITRIKGPSNDELMELLFQQNVLKILGVQEKLLLTKQILQRLYTYKKPIAAAGAVGLGSLALYAGWKLLKN